jgi:hypothetical protein
MCFVHIERIWYRGRVSQAAKRKAKGRTKGKVWEGGFRGQRGYDTCLLTPLPLTRPDRVPRTLQHTPPYTPTPFGTVVCLNGGSL